MTQEYVGPKRTSMIRVDHHRTPVLSQHQLGRGQCANECPDLVYMYVQYYILYYIQAEGVSGFERPDFGNKIMFIEWN